jgi:hypothetical protein
MINALHLLWIAPLSVWFGYILCAVLTVGKGADSPTDEKIDNQFDNK